MNTSLNKSVLNMPLAVTGMGVYSPIGKNPTEFWDRINRGECSLGEIKGFPIEGLKIRHAAEIADHDPAFSFESKEEQELDWTAQFGILAARQALHDAAIDSDLSRSARLGLVIGVCAGGQGLSPRQRAEQNPFDLDLNSFPETSIYRQTDAIGKALGIHGPRSTVSTACASSGSSLGFAYELLQAGHVDAVVAGGADAFSISTYAGFYALGAMPEEPMSPFSENIGVSFGEGAGFVVLEPLDRAEARGAKIYGLLLGYGCTGDAHHVTSPHPSGEGLQRAMAKALRCGGMDAMSINYINAHGTATRDNDRAESSAIRELYRDLGTPPPVSSSKSQFGHTLGAAGVLEFIVSILAQQAGKLPPTVNFVSARPGCDLDYVPNQSRTADVDAFLSNSAAFGGINVSVLGGSLKHRNVNSARVEDEIWVTGIGVVSSIGCGVDEFRQGLLSGRSGISSVGDFDTVNCGAHHAALMGDFKARKLAPTIDVRRTDPLNRFAMVAAALAIKHSKLEVRAASSDRVGMVMSLNYGSLAVQERFRDSLLHDGLEKLSAKHFPSMVVSTVGGTVAQSFNLRGYNCTIVDGITAGLHGLIHADAVLRGDDSQDAIVVVAADEVAPLLFNVLDKRGLLAPTDAAGAAELGAYQGSSKGLILGEGGVALVLERASKARARGAQPLGRIAGYGLTADATLAPQFDSSGDWHCQAIENAMQHAGMTTQQIDLIYGHGRGQSAHDAREIRTLKSLFGGQSKLLGNVMANTGIAGATSGLFSVAASLLSLQHNEAYPVIGTTGDLVDGLELVREPLQRPIKNVLVTGSTENGNNSAVIISSVEA